LIPGFNGGSRIHRDHRSWKRDHVVERASGDARLQSANHVTALRQPGGDSTHQEALVAPKNKAHCHSTSSNTRMGRARDESTRVRGYEVPEGRHPHRTVAWTGTRGLCTRNRPSEAKEGRKGYSWTVNGRGKNEDATFGLETKRQWVATRYQGGSRPRGCKEAWDQEERSISRGSVSRLELKSWWRSYGMTDEDRAVAVSWTIE
jgi:hypothetical protein